MYLYIDHLDGVNKMNPDRLGRSADFSTSSIVSSDGPPIVHCGDSTEQKSLMIFVSMSDEVVAEAFVWQIHWQPPSYSVSCAQNLTWWPFHFWRVPLDSLQVVYSQYPRPWHHCPAFALQT